MRKSQLYSKLAVERCRVYTAQLCAANHFMEDDAGTTVKALIQGLNQDLDILERYIDAASE